MWPEGVSTPFLWRGVLIPSRQDGVSTLSSSQHGVTPLKVVFGSLGFVRGLFRVRRNSPEHLALCSSLNSCPCVSFGGRVPFCLCKIRRASSKKDI